MGIGREYDYYKDRLMSKRSSNPYYYQTAKNLSKLTHSFSSMNQKYAQRLNNNDAPESAIAQNSYDNARNWNDMSSSLINDARDKDIQRQDSISEKIAEVEFKRNQAVRQEKEFKKQQKEQEKREKIKLISNIAGAGVGAAASFIPGLNLSLMGGAKIGSGFGAMVGGLADGGIKQDLSYVMQGVEDTLTGFNYESELREDKKFNDTVLQKLPGILSDPEKIKQFKLMLNLKGADAYDKILEYLNQ